MSSAIAFSEADVARSLGRHLAVYRRKRPAYQTVMLKDLAAIWRGPHERLLDVGGGTGVIAQCISELFPVGSVAAVDVVDRFCAGLSIETQRYDGRTLPFEAGSFDAATINNVVHHIPPGVRRAVFAEIARVVSGPLYIKDHQAGTRLDHVRLTALDLVGNLPFNGMVKADYLTADEWQSLAETAGYRIAECIGGDYRRGLFGRLFPNRLEVTMRWERVADPAKRTCDC